MFKHWQYLITSCLILIAVIMATAAQAAVVKTLTQKPKAFFVQSASGLFEGLDLKKKEIRFGVMDVRACGQKLMQIKKSLSFSCTVPIQGLYKAERLREQISPNSVQIPLGNVHKVVTVEVNADGRSVVFTTEFDDTGIDFDVSNFNDDAIAVYSKAAHQLIEKAMQRPILLEVLDRG